jgi:hypothetical protein
MSMATELPNRPTPSADDHQHLVDPTERVQSPTDKPEPRFAAALQRAEREARIRARTESAASADEPDEADADEAEPAEDVVPTGPFSFNRTAGDTEDDQ